MLFAAGQWRGETQGRKADGSAVEQEVALSLTPEGGILCVTRDVEDRRAMEREKGRLREQLMLVQRQAVVGVEGGPCVDPCDAVAIIREDPAVWDLVITDYDMPGMNGAALAKALRKIRPDLPILLLTALPRFHQLHKGPGDIFDGVLGKPTTAARLAGAATAAIAAAQERTSSCAS